MPKKLKTKKGSRREAWDDANFSTLLGVADDYLTVACLLTVYAKDATTRRGMERVGKALTFASKVVSDGGGLE